MAAGRRRRPGNEKAEVFAPYCSDTSKVSCARVGK